MLLTLSRYVQVFEHPGISEGVLLYPGKIQELGNTLVKRARHLVKDGRLHNGLRNFAKAAARKEIHLKRETEKPRETQFDGVSFELMAPPIPRPRNSWATAIVRTSPKSAHSG